MVITFNSKSRIIIKDEHLIYTNEFGFNISVDLYEARYNKELFEVYEIPYNDTRRTCVAMHYVQKDNYFIQFFDKQQTCFLFLKRCFSQNRRAYMNFRVFLNQYNYTLYDYD